MLRASIASLLIAAFAIAAGCTPSDVADPANPDGPGSFRLDGGQLVYVDARIDEDARADAADSSVEVDGGIGDSGIDSDNGFDSGIDANAAADASAE